MGRLWTVVSNYLDAQPLGGSERGMARLIGMSPTALGNWRQLSRLPSVDHLRRLSQVTGTPYLDVLNAALIDTGYLIEEVVGNAEHPAPKPRAGASPATKGEISTPGPSDLTSLPAGGSVTRLPGPGARGTRRRGRPERG